MSLVRKVFAAAVCAALAFPSSAVAAPADELVPSSLRIGIGLAGLGVAFVLLVQALAVRRVAAGGALAAHMSYIVLAVICLAASVIAQWVGNFLPVASAQQTELASHALVIAAMGLVTVYFVRLGDSLRAYLDQLTSDGAKGA